MLLSCIEVSFWNLSFCGEYIRSFKSIRLIFCVKKVLNSRSYPYPKFIKGFLYHFNSGTGAFCKKTKLSLRRLWTVYLCKTLCIRTFICRILQKSQSRFNLLSYKAIPEKNIKSSLYQIVAFGCFFCLWKFLFSILRYVSFFTFPSGSNRTAHSFPSYFSVFASFLQFLWILNCGLTIKREKKVNN